MKYSKTVCAKFIDRPNRFVAHVAVDDRTETVHVKNTGRCKELLIPGADVILTESSNPERKTKYDLISVYKNGTGWINIDSQVPNAAVKEWLNTSPELFGDIRLIRPEYKYGKSRIDFYIECGERRILIEVKGCTLEYDKVGYFPDAPTERGVKHLYELINAVNDGYECYIAFVISIPGVSLVLPNTETHPEFGEALGKALDAGVKVLYLACDIAPDEIKISAKQKYV